MSVLSTLDQKLRFDHDDPAYSDTAKRIREKYDDKYAPPGFFWPPNSKRVLALLRGAVKYEQSSPKQKRIMTKNFHRREKVYYAIRQALLGGPKNFTFLSKAAGGSRSTISNCLKGLCEGGWVRRNNLTRNYELVSVGWMDTRTIKTPSQAHLQRQIQKDRFIVNETCSASFYPRTGFLRIDESKPNLEAAMSALLDPVYFSVRKSGTITFEIEVALKVKGTVEVVPTQREREVAEWRGKVRAWEAEDEYDRQQSWINRKRRAYG